MKNVDLGLLLLRLGAGGLLVPHGWGKLQRLLEGNLGFADPIGIGSTPTFLFAVFAELVCALAVVVGFKTRWTAIPPAITLLTAALVHHAADPWGKKELPLLYVSAFAALVFLGGGKYALDRWIRKRR